MATIRWEGNEVDLVEDWRVGELIEAENALGIDMETAKGAARSRSSCSFRGGGWTSRSAHVLADQVMRMELAALGGDEDEDEAPDPLGDVAGGSGDPSRRSPPG